MIGACFYLKLLQQKCLSFSLNTFAKSSSSSFEASWLSQCDQIGAFLLLKKPNNPNIWAFIRKKKFGLFWNISLFKDKLLRLLFGNLWWKLGCFLVKHLVTLSDFSKNVCFFKIIPFSFCLKVYFILEMRTVGRKKGTAIWKKVQSVRNTNFGTESFYCEIIVPTYSLSSNESVAFITVWSVRLSPIIPCSLIEMRLN